MSNTINKKILLVGPRFHTNQYQMVKTFQEHGHEVFFHASSHGSTEDHSLLTPTLFRQSRLSVLIEKIWGKGGVNRPNYFPNLLQYWKVIRQIKPGVVIIRDPYRIFSLIAATSAAILKSNIIFYTQEDLFRPRNRKTRLKYRLMIRIFKAAWMVPIHGQKKSHYRAVNHMYYVPLPIPMPISKRTSRSFDNISVLMIGKYNQKRKNHLLLIKSVNALKDRYRFNVTMVGECTRDEQLSGFEKIEQEVNHMGLSDIISMRKNVPYGEIGALYRSHHIFAMPAVDEQYGISVTEALGYGLPVICTDTCGARFNVTNGINGMIVASNSLPEFTKALESLVSVHERLEEMGANAERYVRANLSGEVFYRNMAELVRSRFNVFW